MPYWVFNNFLVHLEKILEKKNQTEGGGDTGKETMGDMMNQSKQMYRSAQSGVNIPKMPKY